MSCAKAVDAHALMGIFYGFFFVQHNTRLSGGVEEPLYLPATDDKPSVIYFREDYVSSALHEVAHWCIAGEHRRRQRDYGYWYEPDGRSLEAQQRFMQAEARPQALEWYFSRACGQRFQLSLDNLDGSVDEKQQREFAGAVDYATRDLRERGLPRRGQVFFEGLRAHFNGCGPMGSLDFKRELSA